MINNQSVLNEGNSGKPISQTKPVANSEDVKRKQQKIVGDAFSLAKKTLHNSMGALTEISKHKAIPRTPGMYNTFKEGEDYFMNASVQFDDMRQAVNDDMGNSKDEFAQALEALATASVSHQIYFKNMGDYINTGNLESQRKANRELEKNPSTIMIQATNQIIKVAGDVGMDSESMKKEIGDMLNEIQRK